jgi:hypothetical protein
MGHESQIELWTPLERRSALLVSELTGFVAKQAMKTPSRKKPRWLGPRVQKPSTWRGRSKHILLIRGGCESRKIPAAEDVCFLLTPFIELTRTLH